jgi:hypothetical protein
MKHLVIRLTATLALLAAGCATDLGKTAASKGVRQVRLEPRIEAPSMRFGFAVEGTLSAGLANWIVDGTHSGVMRDITAAMQEHAIDVPAMVQGAARREIGARPELELTESADAPVLLIKIEQYGFDHASFGSARKLPFLALKARLLDAQGKALWTRATTLQDLTSEGLGATWEEYAADPERVRRDWQTQVDHVIRRLLAPKASSQPGTKQAGAA